MKTKQMTNSLMKWHLARDNQRKLAAFCDTYQVDREVGSYYDVPFVGTCFVMRTEFQNGGYIEAELVVGKSISEHYQVVDWGLGDK